MFIENPARLNNVFCQFKKSNSSFKQTFELSKKQILVMFCKEIAGLAG